MMRKCVCLHCTMRLHQHHSYRSSSCRCSSPPGCRSTAELQAGSLPSSFVSPLPGPATRTADCHLQTMQQTVSDRGDSPMPAAARAQAQVGQGHGLYSADCVVSLHWLYLNMLKKYLWKCTEKIQKN